MTKIGIISTFPAAGSRNIGDYLISKATQDAIRHVLPDCQITSFFRADQWTEIKDTFLDQDHIVFACLAIREGKMAGKLYPYIDEMIASEMPFTVLAAGTQLPVDKKTMPLPTNWPKRDRVLLHALNEKSAGFSTRGSIT